jgi:uncharacterized metal-binding protein YceD (DUF177 family)
MHDFSFELDQEFFATLERPEIEKGKLTAEVILEKKPGVLTLHFHIRGEVEVICDRCLDSFMTGIDTSQHLFVKMGDHPGELEEDVIMIHRDDHEIEVGQFIYEYIVLTLPYKRIHPERNGIPGCNPEMISMLKAHSETKERQQSNDPRWNALKGLIEKKN